MTATPKQRQEFARLLRTIRDMARPPMFFARESTEEMQEKQASYEKRRKQTMQRMAPIVKGLEQMSKKYPELREDFRSELKDIGL